MKQVYVDTVKDLPIHAPKPQGKSVQINCFVDADHGGDKVTRRLQTGMILLGNSEPLVWYSKRQNTVESSTFGTEFVALRIATEMISFFPYMLQMSTGRTCECFLRQRGCLSKRHICRVQVKAKHNSICFHLVREAIAAGKMVVFKVDEKENLANLLTKSVPGHRRKFLRLIMFSEEEDKISQLEIDGVTYSKFG